jgi:Rps23 Pro-64 3,4-dihydroxylase Tpa1-like proline 4-hydroxylase
MGYRAVDDPFRHLIGSELSVGDVNLLVSLFPGHLLHDTARSANGDKTYQVRARTAYDQGVWTLGPDEIAPEWWYFLNRFVQGRRVAGIAEMLELPASPYRVELRLTEYAASGWMSRHTDRPDKAFSWIVYLATSWRRSWGGELALYADPASACPAAAIWPGPGTSVAFARSDHSWHEVRPVSASAEQPRRALLIHGYWT